jgi:hypothetical protein
MLKKDLVRFLGSMTGSVLLGSVALAASWQSQVNAPNGNAAVGSQNKSLSTRNRRVTTSAKKPAAKSSTTRCDRDQQETADLSGTYQGVVNYPDGGITGDATLTITGNQFLLTFANAAQTGRITAVTTCTYTAASMMFGEIKKAEPGQPAPPPLPVISLRAVKKGSGLTLTTAAGEHKSFSFAPKGGK